MTSQADALTTQSPSGPNGIDLDTVTIAGLRRALESGAVTAAELTGCYLERIIGLNPVLRAVIAVHPDAMAAAEASDDGRRAGRSRRPLEGIPVLVKDNIAATGLPTSAGSLALAGSAPPDAFCVARLRAAGAVIIGKANLSEWANFRSERSTSGWSSVGGQVRNPHVLDRNPSGSSSGSAAAVAAHLARSARRQMAALSARRARAESPASSPRSGWSAGPVSCRSRSCRTRRGRWRVLSPTRRLCCV